MAADTEGVSWTNDALKRVVSITEGYPDFLQEFGQESWNVAVGPDVPPTDAERAYLVAMAWLGIGPYNSGEVAAAKGKRTTQVGPHRDTLIKRGLCYSPRHGVIAFTVPMFDQFIRRHLR